MFGVTGASGNLGRLVIAELLEKVPSSEIVALVRDPSKVADLADKGVIVRKADYAQPDTYAAALEGINKLLLISSSEVGQRVSQHKTVIDAAKEAGVKLLAYTSILKTDISPMMLAGEHKATEALLKESGIPHAILRNGWYLENYTENLAPVLAHNAVVGHAGEGKISPASRADYAAAAAAVLTSSEDQAGKVYELAGDEAFTLSDYAAAVAEATGKEIGYVDMPQEAYAKVLVDAGLPEAFAGVLADSDAGIRDGWLIDESKTLSSLIGRPTTSLSSSIKAALAAL